MAHSSPAKTASGTQGQKVVWKRVINSQHAGKSGALLTSAQSVVGRSVLGFGWPRLQNGAKVCSSISLFEGQILPSVIRIGIILGNHAYLTLGT
jgi:hypothetical protein